MNEKNKMLSKNIIFSSNYILIIRSLGLFAFTTLLIFIISFLSSNFYKTENILNVLRQSSFLLLTAIGQTLVIITQGIDLSVTTIVSITGCVAAYFVTLSNGNLIIGFTIGILSGGIIGLINAWLINVGKMEPFLATLSTQIIGFGTLLYITNGVPVVPYLYLKSFAILGRGYIGRIPIPIIIAISIAFIFYIITSKTVFGKYIYAIGGNPNVARVSGIKVERIIVYVYIISGLLSGLAGVLLASRLNSGQPNAGKDIVIMSIAATVVGGTSFFGGEGTIWGTFLGVILIGIIGNGLNLLNVSSFLQQVVIGSIIVIAIILDRSLKGRQ
jgi:ribose/xylose/arabinose/galactoside ABC-type transport system permease subunit